jgi:hypothetical protein
MFEERMSVVREVYDRVAFVVQRSFYCRPEVLVAVQGSPIRVKIGTGGHGVYWINAFGDESIGSATGRV